jgi:hypothetical protein
LWQSAQVFEKAQGFEKMQKEKKRGLNSKVKC